MKIIYSPLHKEHRPPGEYSNLKRIPAFEIPECIEAMVEEFKKNGLEKQIISPKTFPFQHIQAIHHKNYGEYIQNMSKQLGKKDAYYPPYFIMDTYTPIVAGTYAAAVAAVDCALTGAELLKKEKKVYALCRPPGHHAEYNEMGGYCYFNNAAIAAEYLTRKGKVAILDIDYHHGNGTQHIFYDRSDVLYVSIHANPTQMFPFIAGFEDEKGRGEGQGFNYNFPLPLGTDETLYIKTLKKALKIVKDYEPSSLIVSCGFDTYQHDPIGKFKLTVPFYETMAKRILELDLPTFVLQEGGYYVPDLGKMAYSFYKGLV